MGNRIRLGIADPLGSTKDFIDAWKRAEQDDAVETEQHLRFENLDILLKTLPSSMANSSTRTR